MLFSLNKSVCLITHKSFTVRECKFNYFIIQNVLEEMGVIKWKRNRFDIAISPRDNEMWCKLHKEV